MATSAQDIVDALDALILAKINGAEDLKEFYNKRLGSIGIDPATSLSLLTDLRIKWKAIANDEGDGPTESEMSILI